MTFLHIDHQVDRIIWRIHRPERGNGLGTSLARELITATQSLDPSTGRVLVLTTTPLVKDGRATWIAGGDLKELAQIADREQAADYADLMGRVCESLCKIPIPVIAAVDGAAIGGGAELALWCDERLMTERSSLEFRQLKAGLACGYGTTRRLCDLVGLAQAQQLVYRCASLSAVDARQLGLCTEVVANDDALQSAIDRAVSRWRVLAPEAVAAQKLMFWSATHDHPGARRQAELMHFVTAWGNSQHRAHLDRFKR